jgi:ribosomal subunit interface protein
VVLEVQKFHHISEITAIGKNLRYTAKEQSEDMYAAFDKSFNNIQLQLRRQSDRVKDHKGRRYVAGDETAGIETMEKEEE